MPLSRHHFEDEVFPSIITVSLVVHVLPLRFRPRVCGIGRPTTWPTIGSRGWSVRCQVTSPFGRARSLAARGWREMMKIALGAVLSGHFLHLGCIASEIGAQGL